MSAKRVFFGVFQKIMVFCCTMFFGFTNAFSANLPSGYTELEYIQGDGNAYIKTDVVPTSNTGMKIMFVYGSSGSAAIAGTYDGNAPRQDTFFISTGAGTITGTTQNLIAHRGTVIPAQGETETTETPVAGKTYTANINYKNSGTMGFEGFAQRNVGTANVLTNKVLLFARLNYNNNNITASASKIKYVEFTEGNNVSHKLVPAKRNSDSAIGMYDTVGNRFYTNQGTGTFTAGPEVVQTNTCPNGQILHQYESAVGTVSQNGTPSPTNPIEPVFYQQGNMILRKVGDYADSYDATTGKITRRVGVKVLDGNENWDYGTMTLAGYRFPRDERFFGSTLPSPSVWYCTHYLTRNDSNYNRPGYATRFNGTTSQVMFSFAEEDLGITSSATDAQATAAFKTWLAQQYAAGTPVTVYYPLATPVEEDWPSSYCQPSIKIATTAYNAARFNPVKTDLNNAVATIREIVTKTINQTAAIASLQADKQTRPEDACPAGKKCLLVETEENGVIVPHWFPIIEDVD